MAEKEVTCQVSCQLCGWNAGGTVIAEEANVFEGILRFVERCSLQHPTRGPAGKLLVVWEPLESATG